LRVVRLITVTAAASCLIRASTAFDTHRHVPASFILSVDYVLHL
jgi:hypothetical protein